MDELDKRILRRLATDGRTSMSDLGDAVGLSPTPTARRVRALEETGVIAGYSARFDDEKLGYPVTVFVSVQLDKQIDEALANFEQAISAFEEVVDCWLMTGTRDYLMRVSTVDLKEFERFLTHRLTKVRGVASIESSIPLRRVKANASRTP
ncbi:Lrp/AsnC family transcriptional regulator [Sagittula sp. NFXS13]|uniref:Lrp/AsnC family transcriptional regulator n=1 Tax=Sagittula sp. NFXS13 TaxID=2819095 RepID=UPI0032DEC184